MKYWSESQQKELYIPDFIRLTGSKKKRRTNVGLTNLGGRPKKARNKNERG